MKKVLIGCGGLVLVVLLLLLIVGAMASPEWDVERKATVAAAAEDIHAVLVDLTTWKEWSYWNERGDPTCRWEFRGEPGTGMTMSWEGDKWGEGSMTVLADDPRTGLTFELTYVDQSPIRGGFAYAPVEGGTEVRWSAAGAVGSNPFEKLLAQILASAMLGTMYDEGLAGLKARVESAPAQSSAPR